MDFFITYYTQMQNKQLHKNPANMHSCVLEADKAIPELSFVLNDSNTIFAWTDKAGEDTAKV